jgi:hypothetical protein
MLSAIHSAAYCHLWSYSNPPGKRLDRGDVKTRRTREPLFDAAHSLVLAAGARQQQQVSKQEHEQSWAGGGDGVLTWSTRPRASQSMKHPRPRLHAQP